MPNEDVTIINLRSELWVLEDTYINQKMMDSYVFTYHGQEVRAIYRSMAGMVSLRPISSIRLSGFKIWGSRFGGKLFKNCRKLCVLRFPPEGLDSKIYLKYIS